MTRAALLRRRDEHIGRLEIPAARALLEPLAERVPNDVDGRGSAVSLRAIRTRYAAHRRGGARGARTECDRQRRDVRMQKDVYDDYVRTRDKPPSCRRRWQISHRVALGRDRRRRGRGDACLRTRHRALAFDGAASKRRASRLARALRERGDAKGAVRVLEWSSQHWPASVDAGKARILLADTGMTGATAARGSGLFAGVVSAVEELPIGRDCRQPADPAETLCST